MSFPLPDNFPTSWKRNIIVKDFFMRFCDVTEVNFISKNSSGVQRLVVSFEEDIVRMLVVTLSNVPWDNYSVFVMEVSGLTLGDFNTKAG